ncbi:hypothetical protein Tco_0594842 [Tanacetum coccineum]
MLILLISFGKTSSSKSIAERTKPRNKKHCLILNLPNSSSITSQNETLTSLSDSVMHMTYKEELVGKLKFVANGEPKGKHTYGMLILEAMMRRGRGKGYMRKGGLEVNASKKKKAEVSRRSRTIIVAGNLLEDPDQDVDLAKSINLEENHQREKERRSKARHVALVLEKEVNKEVDEGYNA